MTLPAFAEQSIELAWSPSVSPDVVGYNVYYGKVNTSNTNEISTGKLTNLTIPGLAEGSTYFFTITAVNNSGIESGGSSPLYYSVPTKAALWGTPFVSIRGVSMPVTGLAGHLYAIQVSTNLIDWTSVETNLTPLLFTDKNASRYPIRFYRAVYLY
ncbi:MAG TPA: fibronectin type III domain-containing protein [Verrucomicrobiae bacterium]|nr:fibronectin type III domain-containing protein [Verrucomicrobiae bacterium]